MIDRCKTNNNKNHSRVLLVVEEDTHCQSEQRRSDHNSSSASFDTLLPKNGLYNLDAFFDSDIISLNGSILEEDQNLGEDELLGDSLSRADIALPNLQTPSKLLLPCEKNKEQLSSISSQGKVLNTSAFDSLKRKAVSAVENKKEKETPKAKMVKIRTSPIQAWKNHSKSDESVTTKRVVERKQCFTSKEDKVQISDETKQHGTSLSNEIFQHYKVVKFKESDIGCKRDQLETGYAGLACAYCDGSRGRRIGGRYFPSSIKTMADPNKVLLSMHKHLQKCSECPSSTKKHLMALHEVYDEERSNQPRGSQRKFYKGIWDFLRRKDYVSK